MHPHKPLILLAMLLLARAALAQRLDCPAPTSAAGRPCEVFHYHVLMYRPDTRGFAELYGTNAFASMNACERTRAAAVKANLAIVDFFKRVRNEQQYEPDRFGSCHCDMTVDKASPNYLTDAARVSQLRLAEDVRLHVRERLMDADVVTDSELIRSLAAPLATSQLLGGPKLVPLPARAPVTEAENPPSDLESTKAGDAGKPALASVDLPLVDVPTPSAVTAAADPVPASRAAIPTPAPATAEVTVAPSPQSSSSTAEPASPAVDPTAADDAAENFITYETQRIQNVLKASSAIADEKVKAKIFEACMQRIQLLSNLRRLIQGSGVRSRLAAEARTVRTEGERQAFVARLFGNDIRPHWAPKDAADVILDPRPDVDADADRVLRDTTGRFSIAQKKRALYVMLARSQPTEGQQLWLTTLVDSFLQ